jgi:hypothetical protein
MKKHFVGILTAVFSMAAFAMATQAQAATSDQLVVKVPYEFVVGGKTLPAGTYRVSRVSFANEGELLLNNVEEHVGVLLSASEWAAASANQPALQFQQIAGQHFLSGIKTAEHVFTIPVSKSAVLEAMKSQQGSTPSNAAGND